MPKVQGSNPSYLPTMQHHHQQDLLYSMSQQVVDTVICRFGVSNSFIVCLSSMLIIYLVIENCGAMPDLEDREGEVSFILSEYFTSHTNIRKLDGFVQGGFEWSHIDCKLPCAG